MVDFTKLMVRMSHGATTSWLDRQILKQALLVYLLVGQLVCLMETLKKIKIKIGRRSDTQTVGLSHGLSAEER